MATPPKPHYGSDSEEADSEGEGLPAHLVPPLTPTELNLYIRANFYPDLRSSILKPIRLPPCSRRFTNIIDFLCQAELHNKISFEEQPHSHLLSIPLELLEMIICYMDLDGWISSMSTCKQLLFGTLDLHSSTWKFTNFPLFEMMEMHGPARNFILQCSRTLPISLKPSQTVLRGAAIDAETLDNGTYLLRVLPDDRGLNWIESIHSFQTELPWPLFTRGFKVGYYEVSLIDASREYSAIGIGCATGEFHRHGQMVGWRADSYAYHSDDGGMYHHRNSWAVDHFYSNGRVARALPPDTIGCGVICATGQMFYTMNGHLITKPPWKLPCYNFPNPTGSADKYFFPTISLLGCGDGVTLNLGGKQFAFNLGAFMAAEAKANPPVPSPEEPKNTEAA